MNYPKVMDEFETLRRLQDGFSIARFGDGELKMVDGYEYVRENRNKALTKELRSVLRNPAPTCLLGIPTMEITGPKYGSWVRHKRRFEKVLSYEGTYYSAFISRPDSAPWIRTRGFAVMFRQLWLDKRVAVVCEPDSGTLRALRPAARKLTHIPCPSHGAFKHIDEYEERILHSKTDIAFLSCGVTASCLANRLAASGFQAIDFGSGGSFLAKLLEE